MLRDVSQTIPFPPGFDKHLVGAECPTKETRNGVELEKGCRNTRSDTQAPLWLPHHPASESVSVTKCERVARSSVSALRAWGSSVAVVVAPPAS